MSASATTAPQGDAWSEKLPAQLAGLAVGDSVMKGRRYKLGALTGDDLTDIKRQLRNDASAAMARAKRRAPDYAWMAECGDFRTDSNDLIVCLVITRKA